MKPLEVIDAPSVLGLFPRGVQDLPAALHRHKLVERIGAVAHHVVVPPPFRPGVDAATGINNSSGLISYAEELAARVGDVLDRGSFPLILGGDCSITFGPLLALAQRGRSGYLFMDGHADFSHPSTEPSGEAASMDLALATGRGPELFGPIGGYRRLVDDENIAVVGHRVQDDGTDRCRDEHIDDTPITTVNLDQVREGGTTAAAADALRIVNAKHLNGFWIHIDADVLDDAVMPAVDYRNPGGLSWDELTTIVGTTIATGRTHGLDVTIFNPWLDPDGSIAARLTTFLVDVVQRMPETKGAHAGI